MMSKQKQTNKRRSRKKKAPQILLEFLKLQLAGNVPFWGTYLLFALFDQGLRFDDFTALMSATILANIAFFVINDRWVFKNKRKRRKTTTGVWRFITFMSLSSLLTFTITWQLQQRFGITPYIGQFISAAFSTLLTFIGLRFWVFAPPRRAQASATKNAR